ncbi:FkbM family methyltransferase [Marinivivus vitaminiproducens]|uniref:FkbM family methyltransferase n=1 Tax=Marinivivus vitaminiproducens TaxID=3035935 RepID=UPI00279D1113|nr:FkbM family methyltransferase [Geminicoccaceae bacterium SCSIO 64248]
MRKLAKASRLVLHAPWRHALFAHRVAASIEHAPLAGLIQPLTVLDVGANRGQFALWARSVWCDARVIAFEPLASEAEVFERVLPDVTLHRVALGEASGNATIHLSARRDSSSLLPIGPEQIRIYQGTEEVGTVTVPVHRLDEIVEDTVSPTLLKIDVQGYELWTLRGAKRLLADIAWVYVECSTAELYVGQALRSELTSWLGKHGFSETATISDRGVQADVLFSRAM